MYECYLDGMLLPVTPSQMQLKIKNQNKTATLMNDGEINILKKAGLTEISFTMSIPQVAYPFAIYENGFQKASVYLDKLESLKVNQKPFQFILCRMMPTGKMLFDTNMTVSLEDYSVNEDKKDGFDLSVDIRLKQYRAYATKTVKITIRQATVTPARTTASASKAKTHTVKSGDTLWGISRKYYGAGTKWQTIYNANKTVIENTAKKYGKKSSSNGHWIYPGTKLTIP